jgi:hypothetical protein
MEVIIMRRTLAPALIALALGSAAWSQEPGKELARWTFEGDEPGGVPLGFKGEVGTWQIVENPDGNKVLAQLSKNEDDVFNVVLIDDPKARDLDLSVKFHAMAGVNDQGGGLVWRAKNAKNYYIARQNPLENNFRVYKVVDGKRTQLATADVKLDKGWHTIRVVMVGDKIRCDLDGEKWLEAQDSTFAEAGRVGLWTKSDARTQFNDVILKEAK